MQFGIRLVTGATIVDALLEIVLFGGGCADFPLEFAGGALEVLAVTGALTGAVATF